MFLYLLATICYFAPPSGWQPAKTDDPASPIELAFIGPAQNPTEFAPNISLAFEEVDCSLKEYVQGAKEHILAEPGTSWRDLGKFRVAAGDARLTESSGPSPWGDMKSLQVLFVKGTKAYILTATMLKKDFGTLQPSILNALKSLTLAEDLWAPVHEHPLLAKLQQQLASLQNQKELEAVGRTLEKEFSQMGAYWHFLVLREAASFINSSQDSVERGEARSKRSAPNDEFIAKAMDEEEDGYGKAAADRVPDEFMKEAAIENEKIFQAKIVLDR